MGGSSRAAEAESGRLYEVSRPDGADERAASRAASGVFGPGHLHAAGPADQVRVPPVVDQVLASGGTPLDAATRGVMEPRLGHSLADVRIHAGPDAALAAQSVRARAFTAGSHVVLGSSAPPAASPTGTRLLAHELTHVAQQAHGGFRLQRVGLEEDLQGGESSASVHPLLDQMQVPEFLLVDADALEQALSEALAADPSTQLPAPSPGDTDVGFTMAGPVTTGYALSFEYQPRPGGAGRLDQLARTYIWTLTGAAQTVKIELTYPGSGTRAVRQVTVVNQLDGSGSNTINISYDVQFDVPPEAETLTRHPSLTEVLEAPSAARKPQIGQVPAAVPAPEQPADPTARVEVIHPPPDDATFWQELVAQLRSAVGAGLEHALGQVSGVALALSGTFVDPALWMTSPEAKRAAVDAFLNLLPVTVPPTLRTAVEEAVTVSDKVSALSVPPQLSILRAALMAAGFTDPYSGAPSLSLAISALTNAIDKDVIQPLFGAPDPNAIVTPLEAGQLEGEVAANVALGAIGVKEIQIALKVLGGMSLVKSITDLITKDDKQNKPWLTDPAFYALILSGVLYVLGLGYSSADQKLVAAVTEWLSSALGNSPAVIQLAQDLEAPEGPEKEKKVHDDVLALIRALALLALPLIGMTRKARTGSSIHPELRAIQEEHALVERSFVAGGDDAARDRLRRQLPETLDTLDPSLDRDKLLASADEGQRRILAEAYAAHLLNEYIDKRIAELGDSAWNLPQDLKSENAEYYAGTGLGEEQELKRLTLNVETNQYNFNELRTFIRGVNHGLLQPPLNRSWREGHDIVDAAGNHWQVKAYGRPQDSTGTTFISKPADSILDEIFAVAPPAVDHLFIDLTNLSEKEWRELSTSPRWEAAQNLPNVSWVDDAQRP